MERGYVSRRMTMKEWFHEMFLLAKKAQAGEIAEADVYTWAEEHTAAYEDWAKAKRIEKK